MSRRKYNDPNIPKDTIRYNIWEYLPVTDILSLCEIRPQICADPRTWSYLIYRDYDKDYNGLDSKQQYFAYGKYLNFLEATNGNVDIEQLRNLTEDELFDIAEMMYLNPDFEMNRKELVNLIFDESGFDELNKSFL